MITFEQLKKIVPNISKGADVFVKYLNEAMVKYEINTPQRQAAFIAQCAHESGGFKFTREQGNTKYLSKYTQNGVCYCGRGLIQVTWLDNYKECGKELGLDLVKYPQLLETPQYACLSAGWFWKKIKGNGLSDLPDDWRSKTHNYTPYQYITYRINGGLTHLAEREAYRELALEALA